MRPIAANALMRFIQKKVMKGIGAESANQFTPYHEPGRSVTAKGELWVREISYGSIWPNGFCDIWYPNEDTDLKRPTLFYFHGGGFCFGSKSVGDPLAAARSEDDNFISELLKIGFNVVNADYALAPQYHFPIPVLQMNELFDFFLKNGSEYGVDMDRVVIMGGSAGADMTELYGAAMSNPEYARELGVKPVLDRSRVKALIIDEAALDFDSFNGAMNTMTRAYIGDTDTRGKGRLLEAHKFIRPGFAPAFINTSNKEIWFVESARKLRAVLEKNGDEFEYCYFEPSVDALEHGYMNRFPENECARKCLDAMLNFAKRHVEE